MKFKKLSIAVLACAALFCAAAVQAQEKLEIFSWWAGDEGPALEARADLAAAAPWGSCGASQVLESDGGTRALVRFACERGHLDTRVAIDGARGKIEALIIAPARDSTCLP